MVHHIIPRTANYLRFSAFLVSGSYAPVILMPRPLRYVPLKSGHKNQLKSKVRSSESSLFSCRVRCQEYMGST
jgi:hypothetical protein